MITLGICALLAAALAAPAWGCTVCFGDSDSPVARGADLSILFMACLTYLTIGGGLAAVVVLRRRQLRRAQEPEAQSEAATRSQPPEAKER